MLEGGREMTDTLTGEVGSGVITFTTTTCLNTLKRQERGGGEGVYNIIR